MTITTYNVLTGLAYITLVVVAIIVSWKKGEKEGSVFMLQYLRENKFFNDSFPHINGKIFSIGNVV